MMIKQRFRLEHYDWEITIFYSIHGYCTDEIMDCLYDMGISGKKASEARNLLNTGKLNTGLTYANNGKAVSVIGKASSASEYANSIQHEVMHLAIFIAIAEGIPLDNEEVCYIGGEIAEKMHPKSKLVTSECGCYAERIGKRL